MKIARYAESIKSLFKGQQLGCLWLLSLTRLFVWIEKNINIAKRGFYIVFNRYSTAGIEQKINSR